MTNLEYYKDQFIEMIGSEDVDFCCYFNELHDLGCDSCPCCEKYSPNCNTSKFYDWLLKEHEEPIKLTKFEYDLLESLYRSAEDRFVYMGVFKYHAILRNMKVLGHFKGVKDDDMTLARILDNCEVEE